MIWIRERLVFIPSSKTIFHFNDMLWDLLAQADVKIVKITPRLLSLRDSS
jgi:hypothetical protein